MPLVVTQEVELFLGIITFLLSTYLGAVIYVQNKKSWTNRLFMLLAFFIDIYIVVNFFSLHPPTDTPQNQLFWIRMVMVVTSFIGPILLLLVHTFPAEKIRMKKKHLVMLFSLMTVSIYASATTLVFKAIDYPGGEPVPVPGAGIPIFFLDFVGLFILSFIILIYKYKKSRGESKKRHLHLLLGVLASFSLMGLTTVTFVWILKTSAGVFLGPIFPVVLMAFISYSIIRHRLFNVKVLATKTVLILIGILLLSKVVFFESVIGAFIDSVVLIFFFLFGVFLIRSVKAEIRQREELAKLAHSLEKANARLKKLDQQKTEFLSIASHQFRTPLSIIKGYIELIEDGAYGKTTKKMKHVLDDMDESNERLVKLIDGFLDITRIEQGRTKYIFDEQDITITITSVVKELKDRADDKDIALEWNAPRRVFSLMYDEEKIRHVIFNFVDNAIKYTNSGSVRIRVKKEKEGVAVRVIDNGIGFDSDDGTNLFQKFFRSKNAEASNVGGTGLGIYVCRKFVEAHRGRVWATSAGVEKGSEFGFWLPLKQKNKERYDDKPKGVRQDIAVQYSSSS